MTFPTQDHIEAAQAAEKAWFAKTGHRIWTSASLGQVALESAFCKAQSGVNNFGGIKANKAEIAAGKFRMCLTHEVVNGETISIRAPFASYDTLTDFYEAHARVLATHSGYKAGWHDTSPDAFLAHIAHPYATADKATYIAAVKGIMDHYGLRKYDLPNAEPAPAKPPIIQTDKGAAVVVGGTAAATAAAQSAAPHLTGVPLGMIAALAIVAGVCGLIWFLSRQKLKASIAAAVAVKPMTPAELEAYLGHALEAPVLAPAPPAPPVVTPAPPAPVAIPVAAPGVVAQPTSTS